MEFPQLRNEDHWWEVARNCPSATFFHTPLWTKLAITTFPHFKDISLYKVTGNNIHVILPLIEIKILGGFFSDRLSTFAGCYGDLIADGPVNDSERNILYREISSGKPGRISILGNPISSSTYEIPGFRKRTISTRLIQLPSDINTAIKNFSKGHRSSYKKGLKMGVTIRRANRIEDYQEYFKAYEDSLLRWNKNTTQVYPWIFFRNCFYLSEMYNQNIKLWIAEIGERLIAGALVFYWGKHAVWWHGAAYADYFPYYPNNVLQTKILDDAIDNNFRIYDFNPSSSLTGVEKFKSSFGAVEVPVSHYIFESYLFNKIRGIKNKFYSE